MAKNKKKKRNLATKVQHKTKTTDVRTNPFEVKINKQKHSILGKKNKHGKGMPAVSRSKGVQKRNETLLQEYKQRHKTNKFLDRRLGENDPEMSVEEKMMERFALEKQRSHEKSSLYSLAADDELTHYGQSLSSMERFEEPQLVSDEEEDGRIDKKYVAEEHFGGFLTKKKTNGDGKPKSRQEIFEEIIAKSKKEKFSRQNEKEDVTKLTEQLDQDFRDVSQLMAKVKRNRDEERSKPDDYDRSVKELIFDMRAKASDRMKTHEELAREERERLEKLEADRRRRMKGITEEEEEETRRRAKHMSADDLNDGFELPQDKRSTLSYNEGIPSFQFGQDDDDDADEEEEEEGSDGEEEEGGSDDEEDDEEEEEDNASDLESDDLDSDDEEEEEEEKTGKQIKSSMKKKKNGQTPPKRVQIQEPAEIKKKRADMIKSAKEELPYTFAAPNNLEQFERLVSGHSLTDRLTIIERLRKCHHPSLAEGNQGKLDTLTGVLQEYLGQCAGQEEGVDAAFINGLTRHLYELTQKCALASGNSLQNLIAEKYETFNQEVLSKGRPSFPALDVLLYFKMASALFPTSDFRHSVVTPTMLFMGAILSQCQVRSLRDVTSGLYVCNLFLKYVSLSKRFVPEAIGFLRGILYMASDEESRMGGLVVAPFKHTGRYAKLLRCEGRSEVPLKPINILQVLSDPEALSEPQTSAWAVGLTCHLLQEFSSLYQELPSHREVFQPIGRLLEPREKLLQHYHHSVQTVGEDLLTQLEVSGGRPRRVLEVQKKKPVPLKMFEPKIEDDYDPSRKHRGTGNKEYDERQRLVHRHKREMKGAVREMRKDSQFIARQKIKEQRERDDERKEKVNRLHQLLATQEGDFRDLKRKKQKL